MLELKWKLYKTYDNDKNFANFEHSNGKKQIVDAVFYVFSGKVGS